MPKMNARSGRLNDMLIHRFLLRSKATKVKHQSFCDGMELPLEDLKQMVFNDFLRVEELGKVKLVKKENYSKLGHYPLNRVEELFGSFGSALRAFRLKGFHLCLTCQKRKVLKPRFVCDTCFVRNTNEYDPLAERS